MVLNTIYPICSLSVSLQGWVANFSKPRTIPNSLLPSTTGLSPYLSLGCLSVRTFYHQLNSIYAQVISTHTHVTVTHSYNTHRTNVDVPRAVEESLAAARLPAGSGPLERVLLHGLIRHSKLHPHAGKPHLSPDQLETRPRRSGEMENRKRNAPPDVWCEEFT